MHSLKSRKNSQRSNSQSQSVKKNRNAINNMKQNLNKGMIYSKVGDDIQNDKNINSNNNNGKINLSLRKFIFTKCSNSSVNNINKKY